MSWPTLSECRRFVDWSYYQANLNGSPFDVDAFCAEHPEVEGAVLRFCWPDGSPDSKYAHYFDGFTKNKKYVMGYGWINGKVSLNTTMSKWKASIGTRIPKAIFRDWEETPVLDNLNRSQMTQLIIQSKTATKETYPESVHGSYARGGWLQERVSDGEWLNQEEWWLAHWPHPPPDFSNQATSFSELDKMLPIDNNFTPYRWTIAKENVVGWQASSKLVIVPRGTSDGGYFTRAFLARVFEETPPPLPSPKVPVEVHAPLDKVDIKIVGI